MPRKTVLCTIVFFAVTLVSPLSIADESAAGTMANIVISLNHFPSDSDKEQLAGIIASSDSSETEVTIARAITNIAHQASAPDKKKLNSIAADDSVSSGLRDLASAVLNVNHKASTADVAKLEMIASES